MREERDLELENTRQNLDAELARVRAEYTTQYEAIQQSREQQILRLTEEREAECAAAGFEAECTDRFDDQDRGRACQDGTGAGTHATRARQSSAGD